MSYQKSCKQWQALLAVSHPEDDLTPLEFAALERHVAACAECRALRSEYRIMTVYLRAQITVRPLPASTPQRIRLRADLEPLEYIAAAEKPVQRTPKYTELSHSFSRVITVAMTLVCVVGMILASLYGLHLRQSAKPLVGGNPQASVTHIVQSQSTGIPVVGPSPLPSVLPTMTLPNSQYVAIAQQDATTAGISPVYFVRQINVASGYNPNYISPTGAEGIAAFEPDTAAGLGVNPWNPNQALQGAARLMASYSRMYGGDYAKALAAYYGGTGTVQYAVNNCANWLNCLPHETRQYIYVIMGI